jgi:hypothetical protein
MPPSLIVNQKEFIMAVPTLVIVGADKGGVGKSFISRTLLDYYRANNIETRAIDTEIPKDDGQPMGLKRFYANRVEVIDLNKSAGQMKVFDSLKSHPITLIDIRAGLLTETLTMLKDTGFFEGGGISAKRFNIVVLHILSGTVASYAEVKSMGSIISNARHLLVKNHMNENSFFDWTKDVNFVGDEVINIPKLNELATEHVDAAAMSFSDFVADVEHQSETLRGYVRHWLANVFKVYDAAKLNVLT